MNINNIQWEVLFNLELLLNTLEMPFNLQLPITYWIQDLLINNHWVQEKLFNWGSSCWVWIPMVALTHWICFHFVWRGQLMFWLLVTLFYFNGSFVWVAFLFAGEWLLSPQFQRVTLLLIGKVQTNFYNIYTWQVHQLSSCSHGPWPTARDVLTINLDVRY